MARMIRAPRCTSAAKSKEVRKEGRWVMKVWVHTLVSATEVIRTGEGKEQGTI